MANPDRSVYDPPFDDDLMFDTVDEQESSRGRPLMILLGIVVVLAFAGVVWVAYQQGVRQADHGDPPILAQEPGPERVAAPTAAPRAVPDNPSYDLDTPAAAASAQPENIAPRAEEPVALPPPASETTAPPATAADAVPPARPNTADSAPDMTVAAVPAASPPVAARNPVDPLAPGSRLTETAPPPEAPAPAIEVASPPVPLPAADATVKAERDRLAREAAAKVDATKKAAAAKLAEDKRQRDLAAAHTSEPPPATPNLSTPSPSNPVDDGASPAAQPRATAVSIPPNADQTASASQASGRPILLTPPTNELPPPVRSAAATPEASPPPAAIEPASPTIPPEAPSASPATNSQTRSAVVPDAEQPAASTPSGGGQYVVQIGAFNSAEEAAASWKRMSGLSALNGTQPEIRETTVNGSKRYRLRATGYADRTAANSACGKLKSSGQSCFVAAR